MWPWGGKKRAERLRQRAIEEAQDAAYLAWSAAVNAYADAIRRNDSRDKHVTHEAMRQAMNERLKLGC